jgi:hypothetical protein
MREAATARAAGSSLKAHRSSADPPPLPTIKTSGTPYSFSILIAPAISSAAPVP